MCTGHFTTPYIPHIPRGDLFEGNIMLACKHRDLSQFADRRGLAIWRSYLGESVVIKSYNAGAKQITVSYGSHTNGFFDRHITSHRDDYLCNENPTTAMANANCSHKRHSDEQQQEEEEEIYFTERPSVRAVIGDV